MKTEYLQYLIQLSQCKSISLAAEKCHISQQALSAAIKQLEQELGVTLLVRTYQGVSLTAEGKETLAFAKQVLHLHDELAAKFQAPAATASSIKGTLAVYAGPAVFSSVLYRFLPDFYQAYPHITLNLRDMEISNIYTLLAQCAANDAIGLVHVPLDDAQAQEYPMERLRFTPLFDEKLIACVSKFSDLAKHKRLGMSTILKHPLVMYVSEELQANIIYQMLLPYGTPKVSMTTGNPYIFCQSIAQNIGVGIVPALSLNNPAAQESLSEVQLIPLKENLHTTYGYLLPKDIQPSPALAAFADTLQSFKF